MNNVDELFDAIDKGRAGKNIGIKTGLPKMDGFTGGIQKKTYYLLFGLSGSGKSSMALYSYIFRPLMDKVENILIVYFSLEMSSNSLLAKLLCLYIYEKYNIIISYKKLMSWEEPLSDDLYKYVLEAKSWLNEISNKLIIYDKALNRDVFYNKMMKIFEQNGSFIESEDGNRRIYKPNNPELLVLGVIDHIGLCLPKPGSTKKEEIDAVSAYAVTLRERCGASFVVLQQENRNSSNMDRRKAELTECSAEDLKD